MKKKYFFISVIILFGLGFLLHSVYSNFPCFLTSIFFSVNDSLWEHNKLIITSYLALAVLTKFYITDKKNVFFASIIAALICMTLETSIFGLIYFYILKTKDNMIVALTTYFISIFFSQIVWTVLMSKEYDKTKNIFGLLLFGLVYSILVYTSYNPLHNKVFYDYKHKSYGIISTRT